MPGRTPKVNVNYLLEVLKTFGSEIIENLGKSSAPVWNKISQQLNGEMSASAVYTFIKCNRHNCQAILHLSEDDTEIIKSSEESSLESEDEIFQTECYFTVDSQTWSSIISDSCLKDGWTDIFFDSITSQLKTTCISMFKRHKVRSQNVHYYFMCDGYCAECKATLKCWCIENPKNNDLLKFYCLIENVSEEKHTNLLKRPLAGNKRRELGYRLCDGKMAVNWRREQVMQDINRRNLYSLNVLRKCRQEFKQKTQFQEIKTDDNIFNSLLNLKYGEKYYTTIHKIGLDPLFVLYWTSTQTVIYKDYIKKKNGKLFIDATGGLCNKIARPNNNLSGHIFLYVGVIHLGRTNGQLPVTQMLSECHNINQITFWLTEWKQSVNTTPQTVVCDHSLALLGAIARAIAGEANLTSYMQQSFSAVERTAKPNLNTFIRVDYAHLMKFVSKWNCFRDKPGPVKKFYLKLLARLVKITSLNDAQCLIEHILVSANSEYEGFDSDNRPFESENSKLF